MGLGNTVYIWNFKTNSVNKLTTFSNYNMPTHLSWDIVSEILVVGTLNGATEIWDV